MQSSTCKRKFSVDLLLRVLSPSFGVVLELSYSYFRCRSPLKVSPSTDDVARARRLGFGTVESQREREGPYLPSSSPRLSAFGRTVSQF